MPLKILSAANYYPRKNISIKLIFFPQKNTIDANTVMICSDVDLSEYEKISQKYVFRQNFMASDAILLDTERETSII